MMSPARPTPLQIVRYLEEARSVRVLADEADLPEAKAAYQELAGWWRSLAERRTWQDEAPRPGAQCVQPLN